MRPWVQRTPTPVRLAPPGSAPQLRASGSRWRAPPWHPRFCGSQVRSPVILPANTSTGAAFALGEWSPAKASAQSFERAGYQRAGCSRCSGCQLPVRLPHVQYSFRFLDGPAYTTALGPISAE
jgi:hypothetical protein